MILLECNSSVANTSLYKSFSSSEYSSSNLPLDRAASSSDHFLTLHVVAVLFGLGMVVAVASGSTLSMTVVLFDD